MNVGDIKFDEKSLVPVIAQDNKTHEVLMLAYMNKEAYEKTVETGKVHYFSRSRNSLWLKGETSGHFQYVKEILFDCDCDALLVIVEQVKAACHTGKKSCFYRNLKGEEINFSNPCDIFEEVYGVIVDRRDNPKEGSYTNYLFDKGIDKMLKKVGEESSEVIIAAKNENSEELVCEISDLIYHLSVVMVKNGVSWQDIGNELRKRN